MQKEHYKFMILVIIIVTVFSITTYYLAPSENMIGQAKRAGGSTQNVETPKEESPFQNNQVDLANEMIIYEHGESMFPGGAIIPYFEEKIFLPSSGDIPITLSDDLPMGTSLRQLTGYHDTSKNIIAVDVAQTVSFAETYETAVSGYAVYNPPVPFNRRFMRVAVLTPFNNNYPLPQNYYSLITPLLETTKQYYLDNSDGETVMAFDLYPVQIDWWNPYNKQIYNAIKAADPAIDYSQYTFLLFVYPGVHPTTGAPAGGWATSGIDSNDKPYFYQTNDGPIPSAIAGYFSDFVNPEWYYHQLAIIHEIGHILSFWNPDVSKEYYSGIVPHAAGPFWSGYSDLMMCKPNGVTSVCEPYGYGDTVDAMGTHPGSFHYHQRAYFMGLSPISKVREITSSGTYSLCEIERKPLDLCPQELLIMNPVGNNLALELRFNSGPETFFQCTDEYFEGVYIRVVDREEGGGLGSYLYRPTIGGGDVILPYDLDRNHPSCLTYLLRKDPIPVGRIMSTPLADIEVLTVRDADGRLESSKIADVKITLKPVQCVPAPPEAALTYADDQRFSDDDVTIYSNTLQSTRAFTPRITFTNMDICNTGSEDFHIITEVPGIPGTVAAINSPAIPSLKSQSHDLPIPEALRGKCGVFPFTTTVMKVYNPSHQFSISSKFRLIGDNCPCEDSDTGINPYQEGTAVDYTGEYTDYCVHTGAVYEYYCVNNFPEVQKQYINCPKNMECQKRYNACVIP